MEKDSLTESVARLYRAGSDHSQQTKKLNQAVGHLLVWMKYNLPPYFKLPFNCTFDMQDGKLEFGPDSESGVKHTFAVFHKIKNGSQDLHLFATIVAKGFLDKIAEALEKESTVLKGATKSIGVFISPTEDQVIDRGTKVMTTMANMEFRSHWSEDAWEKRRWNVTGKIFGYCSTICGLCYDVEHQDGSIAMYSVTEIMVAENA